MPPAPKHNYQQISSIMILRIDVLVVHDWDAGYMKEDIV